MTIMLLMTDLAILLLILSCSVLLPLALCLVACSVPALEITPEASEAPLASYPALLPTLTLWAADWYCEALLVVGTLKGLGRAVPLTSLRGTLLAYIVLQ